IFIADLSKAAGVQKATGELKKNRYDLLVNNAGFGFYGKFHQVGFVEYEKMMAVNMSALTVLSHAFLAKAKKGDALVNVSSVLSVLPLPGSSVYAATKAYVSSLSDSLWEENLSRGVYVVGICPGYTRTEFQKRAGDARRKMPTLFTQTPEQVADVIWKAIVKRKNPFVVSGLLNKLTMLPPRLLSRKRVASIMGKRG
ncbi:MAG: SDR family NAD(P)-dependent oxidoreductase, partial [Spirochaetia bacterium]|nr:SDR family NAD(P)-dependent oxidoreductase [Spirochaetia bacterium]